MILNFDKHHIQDNEILYFKLLETTINAVDIFAIIRVDKSINSYNIRTSLSKQNLVDVCINQINSLNNAMGIKVEFGKSFKKNTNIFFKLPIFVQN